MINIEILSGTDRQITMLFFFDIPLELQTSRAVDMGRVIRSTKLSPPEVALIKAGKRIELLQHIAITKTITAETLQKKLDDMYSQIKPEVLKRFKRKYHEGRFNGMTKDDNIWIGV